MCLIIKTHLPHHKALDHCSFVKSDTLLLKIAAEDDPTWLKEASKAGAVVSKELIMNDSGKESEWGCI